MQTDKKSSRTTTFSDASGEIVQMESITEKPKPRKKYKQNWRLNLLASPKNPRGKYTHPPEIFNSGVAPGALKCELPERVEHMSRPVIRTLVVNKRQFTPLHLDYVSRMDKRIDLSWNSIYNTYKKARRDKSRASVSSKRSRSSRCSRGSKPSKEKPSKGGKKDKKGKAKGAKGEKGKGDQKDEKTTKGKGSKGDKDDKKGKKKEKEEKKAKTFEPHKSEEDLQRELDEWSELRAKPKKVFRPEPISRGKIADLVKIKERMEELAQPKNLPLILPKDITKIQPLALTYEPTERILELARPTAVRLTKEELRIPGSVKPDALLAVATPRVVALATPKVTQNAHDADVKEDPFAISPNALKYNATARIVELAKPIDR